MDVDVILGNCTIPFVIRMLGCGSFVRGRKRKEGLIQDLLYYRVKNIRKKQVGTPPYISITYPVS